MKISPQELLREEDLPDGSHLTPGLSTILYLLAMDDGRPVIEEITYEGGSAAIENECSMLEDAVLGLLDEPYYQDGWWVMEGFYGSYSRDYLGDVDVSFEYALIRPAQLYDLLRFGVVDE